MSNGLARACLAVASMPVGGCQWLNGESNLVAGSVNQWRHVVKGIDRDKGKVREALVACVTNVVGLRLPTVVGDADVRFCRQIQHHAKCDGNEPDKVKKLFHVAMIMNFGECASVTAYSIPRASFAASRHPFACFALVLSLPNSVHAGKGSPLNATPPTAVQ